MGHTVSIGVINRIQLSKGFIRSNIRNNVKIGPFKKQRTDATDDVIRKIYTQCDKIGQSTNPKTDGKQIRGISVNSTSYHLLNITYETKKRMQGS
jgi:hypothetical protein